MTSDPSCLIAQTCQLVGFTHTVMPAAVAGVEWLVTFIIFGILLKWSIQRAMGRR